VVRLPTFLTGVPHPLQLYRKGWVAFCRCLFFCLSFRSAAEESAVLPLLPLLPFAVACSFVCHSAAQRRNLPFAFAPALTDAVACSFVCHSAAQRKESAVCPCFRSCRCRCLFFCLSFRSAAEGICCLPLLPLLPLPLPVLLFVIPQRSGRNLLFAFAVAVACLFSISSQKTRHLDRSNGQSHRLLRSGEIRFCLRPRF
jgi:hypothetical protein